MLRGRSAPGQDVLRSNAATRAWVALLLKSHHSHDGFGGPHDTALIRWRALGVSLRLTHDVLERWDLVESPEVVRLVRRDRQALAAVVRGDSGGFARGGAPEFAAN